MGKTLVVVESPAKAKTIKKYLGAGYEVVASKGHIKDLPKRMGIDVEKGFQETYEVIESKAKVLADLKLEAKKVDTLLLATDPDREGEAIAWHLAEELKRPELAVDEATVLHVNLPATRVTGSLIESLKRVLLDHVGPKPVFLHLGEKVLRLPDQFNVATDNGLFAELRVLLGPNGLLS